MLKFRWAILAIALFVAFTAIARDTRKDLTVDLKFVPQEGVQSTSADLSPSMLEKSVDIRVEEGREGDAALMVGQGTNDDDQTFAIRPSTDVVAYAADTVRQLANGWGLKVSDAPDRILTLRVTRFFVDESNKAVGSVYAAEVKLTYVLTDKAGKRLSDGAASGSAHRYGRARSGDNCNEVLSDSLKEAFANVISDPRLQAAWASGNPSTSGGTQAAPAESVEDRLKKLDDLLKKGLITKDEYNKKRAEILKDL